MKTRASNRGCASSTTFRRSCVFARVRNGVGGRFDRAEKLPLYCAQGVTHAWLIDPDLRTLEVFERRDTNWVLLTVLENDATVSQPPFDAITFDLALL